MILRRVRTVVAVAASALVATVVALPAAGQEGTLRVPGDAMPSTETKTGTQGWIVLMDGDPVVAYDGDLRGLPATRPSNGRKVNPRSRNVQRYQQHLGQRADRALERAGASPSAKVHQYTGTLDGFAAELTGAQAVALRSDPNVVAVVPNEIRSLTTDSTPDFLGLTDPEGGLYTEGLTGEGVVVGVIDSGVWPENPSFDDGLPGASNRRDDRGVPQWYGRCESGQGFAAPVACNDKLIGARYYTEGFGGAQVIRRDFPLEYLSPRDADGHGTHTASTAAGNAGVLTPFGEISGIAPDAKLATYKVCWGYSGEGGCSSADSVAAIDQAVLDGVDVINYSISGTSSNYLDPVEVAFLFAADAGVVVNASAGNAGPDPSTANHPSPWIITVGAGTEDVRFVGEATLGNGATYEGAPSIASPGTEELPLVFAGDIPAVDTPDGIAAAELCDAGSLDASAAVGRMVVCLRGVIARTAKSDEVARVGGVAMILANQDENSLNSDAHVIPTLHVPVGVTTELLGYLVAEGDGATASLSPAQQVDAVAPDVAAFSSRGPIATGDILVPDLFAPGVDILAAYSPRVGGRDFDYLSGTSMSSPHAAGIAALLTQAHPDWSASAIRSAMMTTASQTRTDGSPIEGGPFAYGSGHVVPNSAVDPGLVYDAGLLDHLGFICGTGQLATATCDVFGAAVIDPSNLNQPNIAIAELAGEETVVRTVTNVGEAATYTASVDAPAGVDVTVEPAELTLASGESATFEVTLSTTEDAAIGDWTFGELTWSDGVHAVTSQLVATPVQLAAIDEVAGTGVEGSTSYDVTFGYSGEFLPQAHGMVPAAETTNVVVDDPANDINTALASGVGVNFEIVTVPEGTAFTRFALFDDATDGADDLDLYVFDVEGNLVGSSGSGTSAEQVDVPFPAAGDYIVAVHGWQTDGPDAQYTLFDWSIAADPAADDGTLAVLDPGDAALGTTAELTATWAGLQPDGRYLGAVSYSDAGGLFGLTLVAVDTR